MRGAYADIIKNANDGNFQFITDSMRLCNTLTEDKVLWGLVLLILATLKIHKKSSFDRNQVKLSI